ncbi:hypothetical protein DAMA08_020920, partial (mitochondrion) [Martiniozyma asiatica (nom. inval.)]
MNSVPNMVEEVLPVNQKDEEELLSKMGVLFYDKALSKLRKTKNGGMYRVEMPCNDMKKDVYKKVMQYFDTYKLKTTKLESYLMW